MNAPTAAQRLWAFRKIMARVPRSKRTEFYRKRGANK